MRLPITLLLLLLLLGGCSPEVGCVTDRECPTDTTCVAERCRATVRLDGATARDAGGIDAGSDDCEVGVASCGAGRECRANVAADSCTAGSAGRCVALGDEPECGCDGWSYASASTRVAARVGFAHEGFCTCAECPDGGLCDQGFGCTDSAVDGVCVEPPTVCGVGPAETASRGWECGASLTEEPQFTTECARLMAEVASVRAAPNSCSGEPSRPPGCCRLDSDCAAASERCYGTTGCATAAGICLATPPAGECYSARDCAPGHRCGGAPVASCSAEVEGEPQTGRCEPRPEGLR